MTATPPWLTSAEAERRRRLGVAVLVAAAAVPVARVDSAPVLCPVRRLTGRPCPACGMTRSLVRLMHGDVAGGVRAHPAGSVAAALLTYWAATGRGHAGGPADPRTWTEPPVRPALAAGAALWTTWALVRAARSRPARG